MNGAGAWPGYLINKNYVEGGKNYEDDTAEHAKEIRDLLRRTSSARRSPLASTASV